jgi:uncharacterized protein YukE
MKTPRGSWPCGLRNRSAPSADGGTGGRLAASKPYMGDTTAARVDVSALLGIARQYQAAADTVESAVRSHLTGLAFDGAVAGRAHAARGDALRAGVDRLALQLRQWSRASAEIAAALRASADRYADADARAARRVG